MFCVRGFGGWLGFLLCGVVLVVRLVFWFSGSGLFVVLVPRGSSARLCGGAGGGLRVVPGSGVDVVRPALRFCAGFSVPVRGGGLGVLGPAFSCLVRGGRVAPGSSSPCWVVGGWACFFPLGALLFFGSGVGLRGLVGVGVLGGVGLGWGFFSGFCCSARAGAGSCLVAGVGVGCGLFGFCLESLILAQDERWRRA